MLFEPSNWNVIVVGRWNRAILTPNGIVTRLFVYPEKTEVSIEVPLDAIGPFKVHCDDLIVAAGTNALVIEMEKNDVDSLKLAKNIAVRAIEKLPETPITAAGFNIRYTLPQGDRLISCIEHVIASPLDDQLAESSQDIRARESTRRIGWRRGTIGIETAIQNDTADLAFNFDCRDDRADMIDWLEIVEGDIMEQVRGLLQTPYGISKADLP